jgi:hypothetical protein
VAKGETELQAVQPHVREGEAHVQRQREIVTKMWKRGAPIFREVQASNVEDICGEGIIRS